MMIYTRVKTSFLYSSICLLFGLFNKHLMGQVSEPPVSDLTQKLQQSTKKQSEEIPVLYVWFGKTVPEDYLISLSELNYPIIFLKNPKIQRKFSRELFDIQKSDYYRLWYLYQYGGLYSDFDNTIDYPCLMKLLEPHRTQDKLIFMTDNRHTRAKTGQTTTNLIFAPYPKMPILKKMLDSIDETKEKVWQFAGIKFVGQFEQPIEMQMGQCVKHSYDWSWFEASNSVLGLDSKAHAHYAKKKQKKSDILAQKQNLEEKMVEQKSYSKYLEGQIRQKSHQKAQLKDQFEQVQKKVLQVCPKAQQILESFKQTMNKGDSNAVDQQRMSLETKVQQSDEQKGKVEDNERSKLWRKITNLELRNQRLQYQKGIYKMQVYGSVVVLLLVIIYLIIAGIKHRKNKFKKLQSQEERPIGIEQ